MEMAKFSQNVHIITMLSDLKDLKNSEPYKRKRNEIYPKNFTDDKKVKQLKDPKIPYIARKWQKNHNLQTFFLVLFLL